MATSLSSFTLYIGDLDKSVTQEDLLNKLKTIDGCREIKLNISKSKHNTKYAFVNYSTAKACDAAIEKFNHHKINGVPMRVMWARPYQTTHKQDPANLFVKGIPKNYETSEFGELFSLFGPVVSFKITYNTNGESLGYGYVQFEHEKDAKTACLTMDNHRVGDCVIKCEGFKPRGSRKTLFNLKVSGFINWDDEKLIEVFKPYGEIISVRVFKSASENMTCYGFVAFKDEQSGKEAIDALNGKEVDGFELTINRSYNRLDRNLHLVNLQRDPDLVTNLYVKNFDKKTTDEEFHEAFKAYGQLRNSKIAKERGVSKGFGYVNFKSHEDASRALKELNGSDKLGAGNKGKKLYVTFFQYRCDRKLNIPHQRTEIPIAHQPERMDYRPSEYMLQKFIANDMRYAGQSRMQLDMARFPHMHHQIMDARIRPQQIPYQIMQPMVHNQIDIRNRIMGIIKNSGELGNVSDEELRRIVDVHGEYLFKCFDVKKFSEMIDKSHPH